MMKARRNLWKVDTENLMLKDKNKKFTRKDYSNLIKEWRDSPEPQMASREDQSIYDMDAEQLTRMIIEEEIMSEPDFAEAIAEQYWEPHMTEEDFNSLYDKVDNSSVQSWPLEWFDAVEQSFTIGNLIDIYMGKVDRF